MNLSNKGINELKSYESLRLSPYLDAAGKLTIGYGHKILSNESYLLTGITKAVAEDLFFKDVNEAARAVNASITIPVSQDQFDSLVSLAYNIGSSAFSTSVLVDLINQRAAWLDIYNRWITKYITVKKDGVNVFNSGLQSRRVKEATQFVKELQPVYANSPGLNITPRGELLKVAGLALLAVLLSDTKYFRTARL